jgi:hypothetical protein
VNDSTASLAGVPPVAEAASARAPILSRSAVWLLLLAAAGIPVSLLWDFSWESTVGIDLAWAPAHVATYLAVALAGFTALALAANRSPVARVGGVRLGRFYAPLGAWLAAWGALAFPVTVLFDRWWQSAYGLTAGIWHPPQILKAVAFFAVALGAWLLCLNRQNRTAPENTTAGAAAFSISGGLVLALMTTVTLTAIYPNRQHSASFYKLACGIYPVVLVALATAGKLRWPATIAALVYTAVICLMVWLLPVFPAEPRAAPVYNRLDHLMPPPFPLLLIAPAVALDGLLRKLSWPARRSRPWLQAVVAGLAFFIIFIGTQWLFAEFLLTDLADNRFFAGGGRHWPFFLKIDPLARVEFWETRQDEMGLTSACAAGGLAVLSACAGVWVGAWMARLRR